VLVALLCLHILLAVVRVPDKGFTRRAEQIEQIHREGHAAFLLGKLGATGREAATIVEHLRAQTPEDAVVLYAGSWRGIGELLGPLLYPRLLYRADAVPPEDASVHGRPLAQARLPDAGPDGRSGIVVLVQDAATQRISLELR
jgi:hypothetical protein